MGWEPKTVYTYDEQGRLASSAPEVEWDDVERDWMLSLQHWRETFLCPCGCGYPAEVAQDPMTEFRARVEAPTRCHVRTAMIRAQRDAQDAGIQVPEALMWRVNLAS